MKEYNYADYGRVVTSRCSTNSFVNCKASCPYFSASNACPALGLANGALGHVTPRVNDNDKMHLLCNHTYVLQKGIEQNSVYLQIINM